MRLKRIKAFFTDVDGVLTDGRVFYGPHGEWAAFDIKDGVGQRLLDAARVPVFWLSGRSSPAVARRARRLGVRAHSLGLLDKVETARRLCRRRGWELSEIAFMGDDLVDLPLMGRVGWAVAPSDAVPEVRKASDHVTRAPGGRGAFREAAETFLRKRGQWAKVLRAYLRHTRQ